MFRYILVILLLLLPQTAKADCFMPDPPGAKEGTVTATWPAKHVEDGDIGGCLLKFNLAVGGEWLGYTKYDFICQLKPDEKITLTTDIACCDTGDHGDFACGVKPRGLFDTLPRISAMMSPAHPDARAIPGLVKAALNGKLRDASAAIRLQEYLSDYALFEEVKRQIAPLEKALDDNMITDPYVRAQVAALLQLAHPESPKSTDWLIEHFKGDIGYALTDAQKAVLLTLAADTAAADRFIPVLVQKLRQTDEESRARILSAIAYYGEAAKPHRDALRDAFTTELAADWDKPAEAPTTPPKDDVEALRRAQMMKEVEKQAAEKDARAKTILPLLAAIACHGETGSIVIGKNYPTTIDCKKP